MCLRLGKQHIETPETIYACISVFEGTIGKHELFMFRQDHLR